MPILADTEARSRVDLKKVGGRLYWQHPSTECLCAVFYDTDSGEIEVWERGDPRPRMTQGDQPFGAHNMMGFDRFGFHRMGWSTPERDERVPLVDTSELARAAGLPGALDALAHRWLGLAKDKDASRFTVGLSSVRRPSKGAGAITPAEWRTLTATEKRELGVLPACGPAEMARVAPYCLSDVEVLAHGWPILETWQGIEPDVQRVERAINDRGVCFDVQLAKRLLEEDARNGEIALETAARELGAGWTAERVRQVASSPAQFCAETGADDATKTTIDQIIAANRDVLLVDASVAKALTLCRARQSLASIARGKLEAGLARVSPDGRLRDSHRYIGGHTWRWSGRGMQLQNMPRPAKRFEDWEDHEKDAKICALAEAVLRGEHCDADEIDLLLRATIHAKPGHVLLTEDFSGVEARALAWAAGDHDELAMLAEGKLDAYMVAASQIFGIPYDKVTKAQRQAGKVAVLACGYGGGAGAIERFAEALGIDLAGAGADPERIVDAWRTAHKPTVRFWYDCERALAAAINGKRGRVSCFEFVPGDGAVAVLMPNGRPLVYNEARASRGERGRAELSYQGHHSREKLYGGKIVENLIQSLCRELLAEALVQAEDCGLAPVLHVHDEAVCEVPASDADDGAEALHAIMTNVPDWAEGFPLGAAGHVGKRYRK
jgi:DNA polymerase